LVGELAALLVDPRPVLFDPRLAWIRGGQTDAGRTHGRRFRWCVARERNDGHHHERHARYDPRLGMPRKDAWRPRRLLLDLWNLRGAGVHGLLLAREIEALTADGQIAAIHHLTDDIEPVAKVEVHEIGLTVDDFVQGRRLARRRPDVRESLVVINRGNVERLLVRVESVRELEGCGVLHAQTTDLMISGSLRFSRLGFGQLDLLPPVINLLRRRPNGPAGDSRSHRLILRLHE